MANENDLTLPQLEDADVAFAGVTPARATRPVAAKTAADLEQVFDVPVTVSAVLGHSRMPSATF